MEAQQRRARLRYFEDAGRSAALPALNGRRRSRTRARRQRRGSSAYQRLHSLLCRLTPAFYCSGSQSGAAPSAARNSRILIAAVINNAALGGSAEASQAESIPARPSPVNSLFQNRTAITVDGFEKILRSMSRWPTHRERRKSSVAKHFRLMPAAMPALAE